MTIGEGENRGEERRGEQSRAEQRVEGMEGKRESDSTFFMFMSQYDCHLVLLHCLSKQLCSSSTFHESFITCDFSMIFRMNQDKETKKEKQL